MVLECMLAQRPCVSICHTSDHARLLKDRLRVLTWTEMLNAKSTIYEAKLLLS